jgi:hypothetical protein
MNAIPKIDPTVRKQLADEAKTLMANKAFQLAILSQ